MKQSLLIILVFLLLNCIKLSAKSQYKLDAIVWKEYQYNSWTNTEYDAYKYNASGRKIENLNRRWNTVTKQWENNLMMKYSYDDNGLLIAITVQSFQNDAWRDSSKTQFNYNSNGYPVLFQNDITADGTNWFPYFKETYQPDENGNNLQVFSYRWNNTLNQWEGSVKETMQFDANQNLIQKITMVWDDLFSLWINYDKEEYSYTDDLNTINMTYQRWDEYEDMWVNDFKDYTEFYEENGTPKLRYLSSTYNETKKSWDYYSREFHTLTNNDLLMEYEENYYNTVRNRWEYFDLEEYTYDNNQNLVSFMDWDKDEPFNRWVNNSKEEMKYNSNIKNEDLILPFDNDDLSIYFNSQLNSIVTYEWKNSRWIESQMAEFSYSESTQTTNITHSNANNISVYPNPTNNILFIDLKNKQNCSVTLFNSSGRCVHKQELNMDNYIDVNHLLPGIYLLQISGLENVEHHTKVIIH